MKKERVLKIKKAAERVIERCGDWLDRYETDIDFQEYADTTGYKETGALKRAILDFKHDMKGK